MKRRFKQSKNVGRRSALCGGRARFLKLSCVMKTLFFRRQLAIAVIVATTVIVSAHATVPTARQAVFQIVSTTKIALGTDHSASLVNLKIGDRVSIAYNQENGSLIAHHIADEVPQKIHSEAKYTYHHPKPSKAGTVEHMYGIVRSVDVQTGTLTIAY
jgi:Cu/Ag efflux protein CusF